MISNEFIYNELKAIKADIEILSAETASIAKDIDKIDITILKVKFSNVFNKIESLSALLNYSQIESNDYYYNYIVPFFKDYGLIHARFYGIIKMFDEEYSYEENDYCEFDSILRGLDDDYVAELNTVREEVGLVLMTKTRPVITGRWISIKDKMPEDNTPIIICTEGRQGKIVMEARYSESPKGFFSPSCLPIEDYGADRPVTHWMPMPEPPQG